MKKMFLLSLLAISTAKMITADNVKSAVFKTDKVTVYLNGAQLYCSQNFSLSQGINEIVFKEVPSLLDQKSIQASGKGNFVITDVFFRVKEADTKKVINHNNKFNKEIKLAKDSLEEILFIMEDLNNKQNELILEKNLLLNNRIIKGDTKKDSLNLLKESLEYLRARINNINTELLKIKKEQNKTNKVHAQLSERIQQLEDLKNQIGEDINGGNQKATYEIVVLVLSENVGSANISISFYTSSAGWYSTYDLRAESSSKKIKLYQKAVVFQNTGIDWKDARLKFSTSNPVSNNTLPVLTPQYLNFYFSNQNRKKEYGVISTDKSSNYGMPKPTAAEINSLVTTGNYSDEMNEIKSADYSSKYTEIEETMINIEYDVKIPYSVKNDGKNHQIVIQEKEIDTDFTFRILPKIDKHAYLISKISNIENLNLISGNTRIYFNGSFVGESYLSMSQIEDTLEINLGRDDSWVVKREQKKDKTSDKILSDKKIKKIAFEINIRNTKDFTSEVIIEDQIPVSNQKEISVKLIENTNGEWDELTGKITWRLKMKPNENKTLKIVYEIHYPSDKILANNR